MAYLRFVWLGGLDEVAVSGLLLLVSLDTEGLVAVPQVRAGASHVAPRSLREGG